jgi:flagellar L-ring protein precursor FlgH
MSRSMRLAQLGYAALLVICLAAQTTVAQNDTVDERRSFFSDRRAHRPGDIFTILVTESSSVSAAAQTTTHKSDSAQVSVLDKTGTVKPLSATIGSNSGGGGDIERSDKLVANLTVTVLNVDDRGNLIVHGEQDIQVNNERQRIRLDGIVRPEDIGPENTVPSSRVGSARIEFTGKGILARKQSPGLLNRILSWFWE